MAKIRCKCGMDINVTNELNEFDLVPGSWIELICQKVEENSITECNFFKSFLEVHQTVYKCSNCYRLWFQSKDGNFTSYIPEYKCWESNINKKLAVNKDSIFKRILGK